MKGKVHLKMKDEEYYLEENIARLVAASHDPQAQPDQVLKERIFTRLVEEQHRRYAEQDFPGFVLVLMAAALLGLAVWTIFQLEGVSASSIHPFLPVVLLLLGLNVVWVPLASILIVKRRRIHG
jgi:hypothetical protein